MTRHTASRVRRLAFLEATAVFLVLASSGAALAQADRPWRGSIECQLDIEQPGYSRHEIQTWTLTGGELPPMGEMRVYSADWSYRGVGRKNQNAAATEWSVDVPATSAPLVMFLRAADQKFIVRLWHPQLTSSAGLRVRSGARNEARSAMEWQLPWIEAAPMDDLEGTVSVQTAALSVDLAQIGQPPPAAACRYRFSRSAAGATPGSLTCPQPAAVDQTFAALRTSLTTQCDALLQQAQGSPQRTAAITTQCEGLLAQLDGLMQEKLAAARACAAPPQTTQVTGRGAAPERTPGTAISALPAPTLQIPPPANTGEIPGRRATATAAPPATAPPASPTEPQLSAAVEQCTLAGPPDARVMDSNPGRALLGWNEARGATGYIVARTDLGALTPSAITALEFEHNDVLDTRVTYQYAVTAVYAQGCGTSQISVRPAAPTPSNARVTTGAGNRQTRTGRVTLTWQMPPVRKPPSAFLVLGPGAEQVVTVPAVPAVARPTGLPTDFAERETNSREGPFAVDLDNVPDGQHAWHITAVWDTPAGRSFSWDAAAEVTARVGFFSVVITGFKANAATFDDPLSIDGRGDEIYVGAAAYIDSEPVAVARTAVHGDVGPAPPVLALPGIEPPTRVNRLRAGSLTGSGGIGNGDAFPDGGDPSVIRGAPSQNTFPLLVWEGWLGGDTQLLVNPSVWEYDADMTAFNAWQQLMLDTRPTRAVPRASNDSQAAGVREALQEVQQEREKDEEQTGRSQQFLRIDPTDPLRSTQDAADARAERDTIAERARSRAEQPDTTAMQLIPIPTWPYRDRYIGTISKTPALSLSSTTPPNAQGLTFKDQAFGVAILDGPPVPLEGDYQIYIAIVPVR